MQIVIVFVSVLVIFALLLGIGVPAMTAARQAAQGELTSEQVAALPLSDHAKASHVGQRANAEIIQEALKMGVCSPKKLWGGCQKNRWLFACKLSTTNPLWGVLFIGMNGLPTIATGFAMHEKDLIATSVKMGCNQPPAVMP